MSKCNKCKYEYSSKLDEPCKYCREKCGVVTLGYQMSEDKFVPKEEQPTTEYNGCDDCYYKWLGESDAPCCECKHRFEPGTMARLKAKDCFKPKEEKGCMKCIYSNLSEFELPCCECKYNTYATETSCLKTKDCFKSNEEKADDEIDMVNHPQHYQHGIEPIVYIESHDLNFNLGNVIKYVSRAPFKGTELEDLKKAKWYLEREIKKHDK
jgi:hypothetical protein